MMRKIAAIMLAFLLVASAALADTVVGEEGDSYVRSGPGRDYAQLGVLGEGETAQYLDSTRYDERGVAWYNVLYDGETGWVSSRYTRLQAGGNGNADWADDAWWVRATGGRVYLRSGPGTEYEDIGSIVEGECLRYLEETCYDQSGTAWYKAQYYSYGEAWVSSLYSELTQTYTEADGDDAGTFGNYIQTNGRVNVRSGPGLEWEALGTLASDVTATYLGNYAEDERGVTWYEISFKGGSGWVSSRYCTLY